MQAPTPSYEDKDRQKEVPNQYLHMQVCTYISLYHAKDSNSFDPLSQHISGSLQSQVRITTLEKILDTACYYRGMNWSRTRSGLTVSVNTGLGGALFVEPAGKTIW